MTFLEEKKQEFYNAAYLDWKFVEQTLKEFADKVRLEERVTKKKHEKDGSVTGNYIYDTGFNQAVSDQDERIKELLEG